MDRRLLSNGLIGMGAALVVLGTVMLATGGDDDGEGARIGPSSTTASPTTTLTAITTTTTTSTTTTSTTTPPSPTDEETPEEFLALLDEALAAGDAEARLFDRLHQATLDRYGADQCRTYLASLNQDLGLELREVGEPGPWRYETDAVALTIPEAIPVEVSRLDNGQTVLQELHLAVVDGRHQWFTDCGDPVPVG